MAGCLDGVGGRRIRRTDYAVYDARQHHFFCSRRRVEQRFPEMPSESAAVVGAAVFLGVSLNMPLTAAVFILELTYAPAALLMPLCTGMAGAVWTARKMGCK